MKIIRVPKSWKDSIDKRPDHNLSRRDFLQRGVATGTLSVVLPKILMGSLARQAWAATTSCPAPVLVTSLRTRTTTTRPPSVQQVDPHAGFGTPTVTR